MYYHEDRKIAWESELKLYNSFENYINESRKILYGRTSKEFGCIEGEFSLVEIDGKKLLGEIK